MTLIHKESKIIIVPFSGNSGIDNIIYNRNNYINLMQTLNDPKYDLR